MYKIIFDELIFEEDFKKISNSDQQRIINATRKKLTTDPEEFGEPLKGPLKGYLKLRVGQYRVVYEIQIKKVIVHIIIVGFRKNKEAYKEALKKQDI